MVNKIKWNVGHELKPNITHFVLEKLLVPILQTALFFCCSIMTFSLIL